MSYEFSVLLSQSVQRDIKKQRKRNSDIVNSLEAVLDILSKDTYLRRSKQPQ